MYNGKMFSCQMRWACYGLPAASQALIAASFKLKFCMQRAMVVFSH